MAATDIKPTRLAAAKAAADAFVVRQSSGVKIGVVSFGNGAIVVQTPTTAHADVIKAIDRLSIGGGTSVGQGLLTSLDAIAGKQLTINEQDLASDAGRLNIGYYGSASVVIFSDGENVSGPDPDHHGPGGVRGWSTGPHHRGRDHGGNSRPDRRVLGGRPPSTRPFSSRSPR